MARLKRRSGKTRPVVVCVKNDGYEVSLELRKTYLAVPDASAEQHGLRRLIDESGEDYLYPANFFVEIAVRQSIRRAMRAAN